MGTLLALLWLGALACAEVCSVAEPPGRRLLAMALNNLKFCLLPLKDPSDLSKQVPLMQSFSLGPLTAQASFH